MRPSITIPSIGTLYQVAGGRNVFWFGRVHAISPSNEVELTINTVDKTEPTVEQIKLVENLALDYEFIISLLLTHLTTSFRGTPQEISLDKLRQMYFCSKAIS